MDSLIEHFGAAYLINLPERADRLMSARSEFARVGWELAQGRAHVFPAQRFENRARFPSAAIRGCFHSHMECLSRAYHRGAENVLIMEDDIALSACIPELTSHVIQIMDTESWDFLYFGHDDTGDIPLMAPRDKDLQFASYGGAVKGAHFYAINNRIFVRLLEHLNIVLEGKEGDQEFGPMPIDGAFNIFRWKNIDVRTLISAPKIGWQRASRSDISPRKFDNIMVLRPIVAALRSLKSATMRG